MSHYTLTVLLPPQVVLDGGNCDGFLAEVMALYEEERFHEEDGKGPTIAPKWDWYVTGGRWSGTLPIADSATNWQDIVPASRRTSSFFDAPADMPPEGYCDGGRLRALDLDRLRDEAGAKALASWNEYAMVIQGTEQPRYWSSFVARVDASEIEILGKRRRAAVEDACEAARIALGWPAPDDVFWEWTETQPEGFFDSPTYAAYSAQTKAGVEALDEKLKDEDHYTLDMARRDYGSQPRVRVVKDSAAYKEWFLDDPIDEFDKYTREEYIELRRAAAVPGFATLYVTSDDPTGRRFDTQWIAPGEMGWFGTSSDSEDTRKYYQNRVNTLIDSLDPGYILIQLDCHI